MAFSPLVRLPKKQRRERCTARHLRKMLPPYSRQTSSPHSLYHLWSYLLSKYLLSDPGYRSTPLKHPVPSLIFFLTEPCSSLFH